MGKIIMKLITKYKLFLEDLEINDNDPDPISNAKKSLNTFEKDIADFHKKKQSLSDLIENSEGKDIEKDIEKIIGKGDDRNTLLVKYLSALTLKKNILKQQSRLEYYSKLKQQRIGNKTEANSLSDPEERKSQIDSITQQLKDIDDKSKEMDKSMKNNEKELKEKEKELDKYIKDSKKEMEKSMKELKM